MDNHTEPAGGLAIAADAAEAAAGMLPLDMVNAVADLVDPAAVAKEMPWLAGELAKIALGQSDISFDRRDQRFSDEAWQAVPYFRILGQSYRLFELWMNRLTASAFPARTRPAPRFRFSVPARTDGKQLATGLLSSPPRCRR